MPVFTKMIQGTRSDRVAPRAHVERAKSRRAQVRDALQRAGAQAKLTLGAPDSLFEATSGLDGDATDVHQIAAGGLADAASKLPHMNAIQRSFGRHDVTRINAHVGGSAVQANKQMGSEAYATGNSVVFRETIPSLHTTAHEAAHVVQQRTGVVSLRARVGSAGDEYEQHADAVADAVVQGKSAEAILDQTTGGAATEGEASRPVHEARGKALEVQKITVDQAPPCVQRKLRKLDSSGCDFDAHASIGIFARSSLYKEDPSTPSDLASLAVRWEAAINRLWTGPIPCRDASNMCNLRMHVTVKPYPGKEHHWQIPEDNSVRIRRGDFRSMAFARWGAWSHSDSDETIAHEFGHLMWLSDNYSYLTGHSRPRFVGDAMANYLMDTGPADFGPARARVLAMRLKTCPCCNKGMMRAP